MTDTFDYKASAFCPAEDRALKWLDVLERTGAENVRIILATLKAGTGSAASITVGTQQSLTVGFAQEWLAWKDKQKALLEQRRHDRQVFWTRVAALAACVAGASTAIGWAWTIFHSN